ncbi:LysR family transcriptional regulator [Alkalihalobacterium alkalinitrilicum]|uniref:LysR family transcriptional regulator n=1 Tax=Alkalihalobacterium alkalinitrilicum TaxID=427920 RepID=UPI0009952687|nr:LysR family transcriptional regulator [Alkalihalobacterium alkalinitrilicum]
MRLEQLSYLIEIARLGSFSLAAERLHISQPSISQAINNLEKELGVKLFKRSRAGAELTEVGEVIVKKAQEVLRKLDELKQEANIETSSYIGKLSIGAVPSICMTLLPEVLDVYKKKYPNVNLDINESGTKEVISDVLNEKIDVGFVGVFTNGWKEAGLNNNLHFEKLFHGEIMACVGKESPLAFENPVDPKVLIKYPIVIFNPMYTINQIVTSILEEYGEIKNLFSSDNTESAKRVIAQGLAIGFYTDLSLKNDPYVETGKIIPLHIDHNEVSITFGLIYPKSYQFSPIIRSFIKVLKSHI